MTDQRVEILLVEDNEDDIVIIQESFADAKSVGVLSIVRDGEEAMAYLRRQGRYKEAHRPELVLLDINMPKTNGFEVLREMKADPALRQIPVVMLTMSEREEDISFAYATGACSYIRKPVDLDWFKTVVKHFEQYWTYISCIPRYKE